MTFQPVPLAWTFDPAIIIGLVAAAAGFVYYRRRHADDRGRGALFWSGLLAFAVALVSPLDAAADRYLLSAHMFQHILLTMVGPPLVLAGLPVGLGARLPRFLLNPWLTVVVFNVVLIGWHFPALYDATLHNELLHVLEHVMFVATAFLFWWPIVGPARQGAMSPLMKIGYLAFAGVPPTVIGMIMALAPSPLYEFYSLAPRLIGEVSAEFDQQVAGVLMFGLGNLIYFVPISVIFLRLADEPEEAATVTDGVVR
ncbi:MAG: cytochrome c oxidase assembly protein [Candidatus Dormiibacterota bacterium]